MKCHSRVLSLERCSHEPHTHTHHGLVDLHKIFFAGPVINGEVNEALSTRIPFFNQLILNTPYGSK